MSTAHGKGATVYAGSSAVGGATGFTYNESGNTVANDGIGTASETYEEGRKDGETVIDCMLDTSDAQQAAIRPGETVSVSLYPEGTAVGKTRLYGDQLVGHMSLSGGGDAMVTAKYTLKGVLAPEVIPDPGV